MDINTCYELTKDIRTIAYYSHFVPVALALFLSTYAVVKTKFSRLALAFFAFTFSFSLWLIGDIFPWGSSNYALVYFTWSWLDFINIVFFAFGAYFFGILARGKITLWEQALLVLICVPAFVVTVMGQSVTDFWQPICEATNSEWLTNYKLYAEGIAILLMLVSFEIARRRADKKKRVQLVVILLATLLFFTVFAGSEFVASVTGIYETNLYALFVLPLFLIVLTFAITDLRLFQFRFLGTQILAYILIIMVGSQLLFVQDSTNRNLTLLTLAVSLTIVILLLENSKREAAARVRIEELAKELEQANEQQVVLIHFITHQIKGFVTKSRNIFATMLEGDFGKLPDGMKHLAEEGLRSDTQGVSTIQEILNAANIRSGKVSYTMAPFDLKALIDEVAGALKGNAEAKGLSYTVDTGTEPLTYTGDRGQLVNVFKNLIDNSIKYTPQGSVTVSLARKNGAYRFEVADTGVGITPEDMKCLFTEGGHGKESTKVNVESTGFGLFIVKSIIEGHTGKVWAESEGAGKGSRFIVELPA